MTAAALPSVSGFMNTEIETPASRLTTTQVGAIAESLVACQLMLASDGRLSTFTPVADDDGTDLVVVDKTTGRQLRIQIKSWRASEAEPPGSVQFDVRRKTFAPHADNFILAVVLDPNSASIWRAWLIPTEELESVANSYPDKFAIAASPAETSKDKYSPYRCTSMRTVADRLLEHLVTAY
ncbi:MAG: hypothetical protein AAF495_29600 [Pseudomonadota bacterium]